MYVCVPLTSKNLVSPGGVLQQFVAMTVEIPLDPKPCRQGSGASKIYAWIRKES